MIKEKIAEIMSTINKPTTKKQREKSPTNFRATVDIIKENKKKKEDMLKEF